MTVGVGVKDKSEFEFTFEVDGESVVAFEKNTFIVDPTSLEYTIVQCTQGNKCEETGAQKTTDGKIVGIVPKRNPKICVVEGSRFFACKPIKVDREGGDISKATGKELLGEQKAVAYKDCKAALAKVEADADKPCDNP